MDRLARVLLNVAYYLIPVVMTYHLWGWVHGVEAFATSGGRGDFLLFAGLSYPPFAFVSEVYNRHQGLRADLLDFIQGKD